MAVPIKVEVDIVDRSRDPDGVAYDVTIDWVDDTLPGSAPDPDGLELLVECTRKQTAEEIRDTIRDAVITALEDFHTDFTTANLTRGNIRVEGYSNTGNDDTSAPNALANWYSGKPFRPVVPNKNGDTKNINQVRHVIKFDDTLNDDQKNTSMVATVFFLEDPTLSGNRIEYWMRAYDDSDTKVWDKVFPTTVSSHAIQVTVDLTAGGQAALWSTGKVIFVLALKRISATRDIAANRAGRITRASISFSK